MCPKPSPVTRHRDPARSAQRGFAIVSAIFLLVVLGALGAFMVTLSTVQHTTSTQDLQGTRAYQAARAGIEWGAYQILRNASCVTSTSLTPPAVSLTGFSVTVLCGSTPYTEGANTISVYQITSTARFGTPGNSNYVERQLSAAINQ
jgi:MSHA biogenesis protein MshP